MIVIVVGLVILDVMAIGAGVRGIGRARRTRRPSRRGAQPSVEEPPPSERRPLPPAGGLALVGLGSVAACVIVGPILAASLACTVMTVRRARVVATNRRVRLDIERSTPDAVEFFVLLIHAGLTPVQAIRELATVAPAATRHGFAAVVHQLERGVEFSDALAALPERLGPGTVGLADVVASADRHGSPLAPMLESLALEARATRRRRDEAEARRLPVRLSFPLVACTLPSFVLLAIAPAVIAALSSISLST